MEITQQTAAGANAFIGNLVNVIPGDITISLDVSKTGPKACDVFRQENHGSGASFVGKPNNATRGSKLLEDAARLAFCVVGAEQPEQKDPEEGAEFDRVLGACNNMPPDTTLSIHLGNGTWEIAVTHSDIVVVSIMPAEGDADISRGIQRAVQSASDFALGESIH